MKSPRAIRYCTESAKYNYIPTGCFGSNCGEVRYKTTETGLCPFRERGDRADNDEMCVTLIFPTFWVLHSAMAGTWLMLNLYLLVNEWSDHAVKDGLEEKRLEA